jgi:hypothetical protein
MNEHTSLLPPFVPTRRSVRALGTLFVLSAALSWVAVGYDFSEVRLAALSIAEGHSIAPQTRLAHAATGRYVMVAQIVMLTATGLTFLAWLHRVRVNVRALGVRRLSFRREWTILGFLVPFVNAFRPYQVVKEIWQASDPSTGDPMAWRRVAAPRLLAAWWALFVAYFLLEALSLTVIHAAVSVGQIRVGYLTALVADVCAGLSASFAYFVVVRISEAQDAKRRAYGRGLSPQAPFDPRDAVA